MKHTDVSQIMKDPSLLGQKLTVCGWVRTARDSKNVAFLALNDGTTLNHLQIVIDKTGDVVLPEEAAKLGAAVKVVGTAVKNERNDTTEINAEEITVLGVCPPDYPLQKKFQKLETLREIPHIRVRTNTFNAVFRVRSVMAAAIHRFFQDRGFVYVNTPLITASDCEGAGEMVKWTTIGYSDKYKSAEEYYADDFFGRPAGGRGRGHGHGKNLYLRPLLQGGKEQHPAPRGGVLARGAGDRLLRAAGPDRAGGRDDQVYHQGIHGALPGGAEIL